jgi:hypothetical protein
VVSLESDPATGSGHLTDPSSDSSCGARDLQNLLEVDCERERVCECCSSVFCLCFSDILEGDPAMD